MVNNGSMASGWEEAKEIFKLSFRVKSEHVNNIYVNAIKGPPQNCFSIIYMDGTDMIEETVD